VLDFFLGDFDRRLVDLDVFVTVDGERGQIFENRLHVERRALFKSELRDLRLADRTYVQLVDRLVEALREQSVDDFLADFSGKAAADDVLWHLTWPEAGNFGVSAIAICDPAPSRGDLFGGDIDDQLARAIGVENRSVLVIVSCFGLIVLLLGFSRFRFAFEGAAGTQDFTFRARSPMLRPRAENEENTAPFGRWSASLNGTGDSRKGQTGKTEIEYQGTGIRKADTNQKWGGQTTGAMPVHCSAI